MVPVTRMRLIGLYKPSRSSDTALTDTDGLRVALERP